MDKIYTMPYSDKEPSEAFLDSQLVCGGSVQQGCFCGREFYCPESRDLDDEDRAGMYAEIEQRNKTRPDKTVVWTEYDSVHFYEMDGKIFVTGCECNGLRKYENWIWENRNMIRGYLKRRIQSELHWAEHEKLLNEISRI